MSIPLLYKRSKKSDILFWEVKTSTTNEGSAIIKTSGKYGTQKPIVHTDVITEGKNIGRSNETTPRQQAESQALSDWRSKQDEGYKTLGDLGILFDETMGVWLFEGSYIKHLEETLELALPQFNTDTSGNIKPMLAQAVKWSKVSYPCLVQPKMDGVRCLMFYDGKEAKFFSRKGKEFTTLGHIGEEIQTLLKDPVILDGEVYSHGLTFQEITSAVKKQKEQSLLLEFGVYDIVNDEDQESRSKSIAELLYGYSVGGFKYVHSVETYTSYCKEDVEKFHSNFVERGYEGLMIRLMGGMYEQGQRSQSLLKVKDFDTNEYKFLEFTLGRRGIEDIIARCLTESGQEFRAKMQGSVSQKEDLFAHQPDPGSLLTVKHHGFTDDQLPRFPIGISFRDYE